MEAIELLMPSKKSVGGGLSDMWWRMGVPGMGDIDMERDRGVDSWGAWEIDTGRPWWLM